MTRNMALSEARAVAGDGAEYSFWREHTHINLSPVAAPSVLGLSGFAVATFMVAANMAGWGRAPKFAYWPTRPRCS